MGEIQKKVFRVFLLALRFLFLQTHETSYSFCNALLYTVKEKGENLIENRTPFPMVYEISIQRPQVWRTLKIMPRNLKEKCTLDTLLLVQV